jgi:hypothetical protein
MNAKKAGNSGLFSCPGIPQGNDRARITRKKNGGGIQI